MFGHGGELVRLYCLRVQSFKRERKKGNCRFEMISRADMPRRLGILSNNVGGRWNSYDPWS